MRPLKQKEILLIAGFGGPAGGAVGAVVGGIIGGGSAAVGSLMSASADTSGSKPVTEVMYDFGKNVVIGTVTGAAAGAYIGSGAALKIGRAHV